MALPPPVSRSRSVHAFLPLADDAALSTRGQALPGLIQNLSSPSFARRDSFSRRDSSAKRDSSARRDSITRRDTFSFERLEGAEGRRESFDSVFSDRRWEERRANEAAKLLLTPQMRAARLIGNSNPRYQWAQYYKSEEELAPMKKAVRKYYGRNNSLIQQYIFIDKLLDSSLPKDLIEEYSEPNHLQRASSRVHIPATITEQSTPLLSGSPFGTGTETPASNEEITEASGNGTKAKVKRTPKDLYKIPTEESPLLKAGSSTENSSDLESPIVPDFEPDDGYESGARIVKIAIYVNLAANTILLIMKIVATMMTSSVSVLASLVDAALDFLSTAIIFTTTYLISQKDEYNYPIGRRRLEPIGILVFSVVMITSFFQVALEGVKRLSGSHEIVQLAPSATAIMAGTVVIKFGCWFWCRLIKNSSVQALAQDAMTDVVFNSFSIIFPLGEFADVKRD